MQNSFIFISVSILISLVSFVSDKKKTIEGFKKGWSIFKNVFIPFLDILIIVSFLLFIIPASLIEKYLGAGSGVLGFAIASFTGSITLIPGFIAYPIAANLISKGADYSTIAVFMTSLMMVGVVTLPLEIKYFGKKIAILRNFLNFVICIIIGICIGFIL